ncbi:hypothetical protein FRB97_004652, partial [Tulasnella sp. 331]
MKQMVHGSPPVLIIIDALDECEDKDFVRTLLKLIRSLDDVPTTVKFLITSREEEHIDREMSATSRPKVEHRTLRDDESKATENQDIEAFLTKRLREVKEGDGTETWPGPSEVTRLVELADGLFQWASTAVTYITDGDATSRLSDILDSHTPLDGLDNMYGFIFRQAAAAQSKARPHLLRDVLGAITVARKPLTPEELSYLLSDTQTSRTVTADQIQGEVLRHLQSILVISTTAKTPKRQRPVLFIHASVSDYLTETCEDTRFNIDKRVHNREMAYRCLRRMSHDLRRNICDIRNPGSPNRQVKDLQKRLTFLPAGLAYGCIAWGAHLAGSAEDAGEGVTVMVKDSALGEVERSQERNVRKVFDELCRLEKVHLLHWMELLSLLSQTTEIATILRLADIWVSEHGLDESNTVSTLLNDGIHFITDFDDIAYESAGQIYHSALPFSPETSVLRRTYEPMVQDTIHVVRGGLQQWSQCWGISARHYGSVSCLVISPDGKTVVSGTYDGAIRLLDRKTGAMQYEVVEGHTSEVSCLAISPDGKTVASASDDKTVRLWDLGTGKARGPALEGHTDSVWCLAISPDGKTVASGSQDETVRLWDLGTGKARGPALEGHTDYVNCLAISPDGKTVA